MNATRIKISYNTTINIYRIRDVPEGELGAYIVYVLGGSKKYYNVRERELLKNPFLTKDFADKQSTIKYTQLLMSKFNKFAEGRDDYHLYDSLPYIRNV